MAYSEQVLHRARARLEQAKAEREQENAAHRADAYARYPRLAEIDNELRRTMAELMAAALQRGEDPSQAVAAVREKNLALQRERSWILEAGDFDDGYLDDTPVCAKCGGRGYVGAQMCSCLRELCRQEQKKELTSLLGSGRETFENFRLDLYPAEYSESVRTSPRALMQRNFNHCRKYAQNFTMQSGNMLFSGATGLGKTFLSACIARTVADRGYSVVYDTAIHLFSDFEAEKFGMSQEENRGLSQRYLQCDLLIIDDLGMEISSSYITATIYNVIDTRITLKKPTIISTNLSMQELEKRYNERFTSRIIGFYDRLIFRGKDIRMKKKLNPQNKQN